MFPVIFLDLAKVTLFFQIHPAVNEELRLRTVERF